MRGKSKTCRQRTFFFYGSTTLSSGHRPPDLSRLSRQVLDLPRIGVAQPFGLVASIPNWALRLSRRDQGEWPRSQTQEQGSLRYGSAMLMRGKVSDLPKTPL